MDSSKASSSSAKGKTEFKTGWMMQETEHARNLCALFDAVKSNCPQRVKRAIKEVGNVDIRNRRDGMTAVHFAVQLNLADVVKVLIENGGDVNIPNRECITPLINAIKNGNVTIAEQLLKAGADPLKSDRDGNSALHYAAQYSQQSMELLLSATADVNSTNYEGLTLLMFAIKTGNIAIVNELLDRGAEPLKPDHRGETALHYAARYSAKSMELFLSKGFDVDFIGHCDNFKEFKSLLMTAADAKNLSTLLLLLNKGADVSLRSGDLRTALHFAKSGRAVEILWEWGADINACDMDGKTPLKSAMKTYFPSQLEVIEALLTLSPPTVARNDLSYRSFSWRHIRYSGINELMMKFNQPCYDHLTDIPSDTTNVLSNYNLLAGFSRQCSLEVQRMKEVWFDRFNLFHVLIRGVTDCSFAANAEMCEFIENAQFERDFWIYHTILRRHLRIAKRKRSLISALVVNYRLLAEKNFQIISLPEDVCPIVLGYLDTAELIRINRALDRDFVIEAGADDVKCPKKGCLLLQL